MAAERRKSKMQQGRRVFYYEETRARNEALDLQVLNLVALELTRVDLDALAERLAAERERPEEQPEPGGFRRKPRAARRGGYARRY